jgi:hypothetical protein
MTNNTRTAIQNAYNHFGTNWFTVAELNTYMAKAPAQITFSTFRKHANLQVQANTVRTYYTVQELVNILNSLAGENLYGTNWNYQVNNNGQAYTETTTYQYRFVSAGNLFG